MNQTTARETAIAVMNPRRIQNAGSRRGSAISRR
jgi:hypothetical protein